MKTQVIRLFDEKTGRLVLPETDRAEKTGDWPAEQDSNGQNETPEWDGGLKRAAEILRTGGLVCFPTETVYGLGANALMPESVLRIFKTKGRPADNPLIVHIADFTQLSQVAAQITPEAKALMERFWPGPLTLLLPRGPKIPDVVTAGLPTVGVRMPDHPVARELIRCAGVPVCAPSANLSTKPSPTQLSHCIHDLNGKIEAIVDGGPCRVGVESTVVDVSGGGCEILRPGGITLEQLQTMIPSARVAVAKQGQPPRAPGMKYRHYSPNAEIVVLSGTPEKMKNYILSREAVDSASVHAAEEKRGESGRAAGKFVVLAFDQNRDAYFGMEVWPLGDKRDLSQAAHRLFDYFRRADLEGISTIYCEDIETDREMGLAVKNRLYKASKDVIRL